jgi:peptidoglycan/LPS O-acetylase OafA/YrhL
MKISDFLKRENNNLDLMRIVLASLVIVGHSPTLNGPGPFWVDPIGQFFPFTYSGALAVKVFFFISGLVVTNSFLNNRSPINFIISRFFRLMFPLLFLLLITVFVFGPLLTTLPINEYFNSDPFKYIWNNLTFSTDYTLPGMFANNFYANAVNGSLWTLLYEVACYVMLLGVLLLLSDKNKYYLNIPLVLILIDAFLPTRFIFHWLGDNPEGNLLPASFAYGVFFAVNAEKIKMNLGIVIGSFLVFYTFNHTNYAQIVFILACCNFIVYLAQNPFVLKLKPKYDFSYGVYLWGFLIQQTTFHYLGHIYTGLHCLIALTVSILIALISAIFIEKPFINLGKNTTKFLKEKFPALK